jgi:predicted dehydrogenase
MSAPVRVGLVGCGRIALLFHLRALGQLPEAELVAIAEPNSDRLQKAQARAGRAAAFTDYQELLALPGVDAVVICLPTGMHSAAACAAFGAGKHVYLEKPLATSLDEAAAVLAAWRASGRVGMIGFNLRFHALFHQLRRDLLTGRIGQVVGARSAFCSAARELPVWKRERRSGGGVLLDLASHHVDLVSFLFQREVLEVFAEVRSLRTEEDTTTMDLRLEGGLVVQSLCSMTAAEENRFEVFGDQGVLTVDVYRGRRVEFTPARVAYSIADRLARGTGILGRLAGDLWAAARPFREPSYQAALAAFVAAARDGRAAAPDLADGYRSLAVVAAAEASARSGRLVRPAGLRADGPLAGLPVAAAERSRWQSFSPGSKVGPGT